MYDGGHMYGFGGGFMWLFWLLVVIAIVLLIRGVTSGRSGTTPSSRQRTPLELLEERYARGEISREEFLQMKEDLLH